MADNPAAAVSIDELEETPRRANTLVDYIILIGMGLFVTTFAQPKMVGRLPFTFILKNQIHLSPQAIAGFWALATWAWYLKPLAGLICDAIPLFGTRRRYWLVASTLAAGFMWLLFAIVPRTYWPYFILVQLLNLAMVFASTVVGGLMVEEGQRNRMTGRLASMRNGIEGFIGLINGLIGGILASIAFGWTIGLGALLLFSLLPVVLFYLHEPRTATRDGAVWTNAGAQFRNIAHSPTMWFATALIFLIFVAPGLQTALLFYQSDVLKFTPKFIGLLETVGGIGSLIGAAIYGFYCRKFPLRPLLYVGVSIYAASNLLYVFYSSQNTALAVEFTNGLFSTFAILPLYDLCARATPKGSEAFAFGLMMSVRNFSLFFVSDPFGSYLYGHYHITFKSLVWINAGTTALVLFFVPFLPRILTDRRDGDPTLKVAPEQMREDDSAAPA